MVKSRGQASTQCIRKKKKKKKIKTSKGSIPSTKLKYKDDEIKYGTWDRIGKGEADKDKGWWQEEKKKEEK